MRRTAKRYFFAIAVLLIAFVATIRIARIVSQPAATVAGPVADASATATPVKGPARPVVLFFADPEGGGLVARRAEIFSAPDPASQAAESLLALFRGPSALPVSTPMPGSEPIPVPLAAIPDGVELRAIFFDGRGTATVDVARLAAGMSGAGSEAESLALWAIVDTLAFNFPADARRVRILLDGQEAETLAGHIAIGTPLAPRRDLVVGEIPMLTVATSPLETIPDEAVP